MRSTVKVVDNIDESVEYIDIVHGESKGWITKAEISKLKEFSQWHYHVEDLLKQDFDKEDVYISAREIDLALPIELNLEKQIDLLRKYVQDTFVNKGMVADFVIHDKKDGNPHAHIMLTMRPFNENGEWGAKAKKEYILDKDGNKIYDKNGNAKSRKI